MNEFTEAEVYRCMKEGRMVALQGAAFQDSYVAEWWVSDGGTPARRVMLGQEVEVSEAPVVRFSLDHPVQDCRTLLIRNGVPVKEVQGTELEFVDNKWRPEDGPAYYRVEVIGPRADSNHYEAPTMPESELFTNPIFIRWTAG